MTLPTAYLHIQTSPNNDECHVMVDGVAVAQLHMKEYESKKSWKEHTHELTVTLPGLSDSIITYDK